jgi:RHS repeat-associated protein
MQNSSSGKQDKDNPKEPAGFSAPVISLPKGGGAIRGIGEKFAANPVTGTGSTSVPIATSPGRSGFGPQLSLAYDSGSGNGPFGFGWSLSVPAITRKTDKGLPQYQDDSESDVFLLAGAEDLVPVLDSQGGRQPQSNNGYLVQRYRPRIEGLFARIERWTDRSTGDTHWRSISKDNITTLYGKDKNSRIFDPHDLDPQHPTRIFSWLLCQMYDDKGNAIVYRYAEEDSANVDLAQAHERNRSDESRSANRYLARVLYGNRTPNRDLDTWDVLDPSADWMFEVVLDYGQGHYAEEAPDPEGQIFARAEPQPVAEWPVRQDPFSTYRAGFEVRAYRLCRRVLTFHHFPVELGSADCLVRSTEFSYTETPAASFLTSVTQSGFVRQGVPGQADRYLKRSLPLLEFEYSHAPGPSQLALQPVETVDPRSLENLPMGLDASTTQWVDLDGEGISGILTEQADGWYYKRNSSANNQVAGDGGELTATRFEPIEPVSVKPAGGLASGRAQFQDLAGDGQVDLVQMEGPVRGFYGRTLDANWDPFQPFVSWPNVDIRDPNLRFVDLSGDGHPDILVTEEEALCWYPSQAERGYGLREKMENLLDEEKGPRLVFGDGSQSIYLADLSGDGLTDLVRIRNGEICYWPNLGYGLFGPKVTMDNSPWFDAPDLFDQRQIRLADIDGSGTTDLFYLKRGAIQIFFNQCGNRWSEGVPLPQLPRIDENTTIHTVDLLGNGTVCLVWSSALPGDAGRAMRYLPLMNEKPHLLVGIKNNLGAETRIRYASSTKFHLNDLHRGQPWITRLPFPVHVVEMVETYDWISRNRFASRYAYHHGYFDGGEREFRGFGMLEQWDTEEIGVAGLAAGAPASENWDASSFVPPVLTRTWFHTGAFAAGEQISRQFEHEYYSFAGVPDDATLRSETLDDTVLPRTLRAADGTHRAYLLTAEEVAEACRSLKGSILRQEIYGLDNSEAADRPYSVSERSYTIELLQARGGNRHAVFFTHPREQIDFHYERKLVEAAGARRADPRIDHTMTLEVDSFGNVLRSLAIAYRRRALPGADIAEQLATHLTLTVHRFANRADELGWYRAGLPVETRTYELVKGPEPAPTGTRASLFTFADMAALTAGLFPPLQLEPNEARVWPYEKWDWRTDAASAPPDARLRLIEHVQTLYRADDLAALLPLGEAGSLALPGISYRLAFSEALLRTLFRRQRAGDAAEDLLPDAEGVMGGQGADRGGFAHRGAGWWVPAGRVYFTPDANAEHPELTAAEELSAARQHFFRPRKFVDPFGQATLIEYDSCELLATSSTDAVRNVVRAQNDYRVLQPAQVTDPNGNRSRASFDALGMLVATAVMGKEDQRIGDILEGFGADPPLAEIRAFAADPGARAGTLLGRATTRIVYDLHRFQRSGQPPFAASLARETHHSDLADGQLTKIQIGFAYSDGFGHEIQKKTQAEPGEAAAREANSPTAEGDLRPGPLVRDADGRLVQGPASPRWVGSGRTVFNNKGQPVKKYEPFFSSTHLYETEPEMTDTGVTPILSYDPLGRLVMTLHPNHTWEKIVFDPWQQVSWDTSDTVLIAAPQLDPDVGDYFRRLPPAAYGAGWHPERQAGALGAAEQDAAAKAALHANTPSVARFDSLGRTFLTVANNGRDASGTELLYETRVRLDAEGNQREVVDARGRTVMRYDYDMLSNSVHEASMDSGERWTLSDVTGKPIRAWHSRGHAFRTEYDPLRRAVSAYVSGAAPDPGLESLYERTVYGEGQPDDTALNLRTRVAEHRDTAGLVTSVAVNQLTHQQEAYDFKGNLLRSCRRLVQDYRSPIDWQQDPALEPETFTNSSTFDALNRPATLTTPDGSVYRPSYNDANLLERVEVDLRVGGTRTIFVADIEYNARRQRTLIAYGNGAATRYEYDPLTFQLKRLATSRPSAAADLASTLFTDPTRLQDLRYTYDPAGNITRIQDAALRDIFQNNERVAPVCDYTYDALYRLVQAEGREHIAQAGFDFDPANRRDFPFAGMRADPNDPEAVRNYDERYEYDETGNFQAARHSAAGGNWTRTYTYEEDSLIEGRAQKSNRLSRTDLGAVVETYTYTDESGMDAGGCITAINSACMAWDFKDQLKRVDLGGGGAAHYVYDSSGQRVRKVIDRRDGSRQKERIYVGGFELYREYDRPGGLVSLERETLHVLDEAQRIALVETRTIDPDLLPAALPQTLIRYQVGNHLGSAGLELDQDGQLISYEEYYPFGCTSFQASRSQAEAARRYRFSAKERDEESGLYYHGARYYAPWLGRWMSCDPAGLVDGTNRFQYVLGNPVRLHDPAGRQAQRVISGETVVSEYDVHLRPNADSLPETQHITEESTISTRSGFEPAQPSPPSHQTGSRAQPSPRSQQNTSPTSPADRALAASSGASTSLNVTEAISRERAAVTRSRAVTTMLANIDDPAAFLRAAERYETPPIRLPRLGLGLNAAAFGLQFGINVNRGQSVPEAGFSTAGGFAAGNVMSAYLLRSRIRVGVVDAAINLVDVAARVVGAPREVTDSTGVVASATPSSFASALAGNAARGLYNLLTQNVQGLRTQGSEIVHGEHGAALQGYGILADMLGGSADSYISDFAAGGEYGPAVRWGNMLGDYFSNQSHPVRREPVRGFRPQ